MSATVRVALDHGYRCTVVAAACATLNLADGLGGVMAAAQVQRVEVAALHDRFATIVATQGGISAA